MKTENIETAIIKVNPSIDMAVIALREEAIKLEKYALERTITSGDDVKSATNDLSLLSRLRKAVEEKRREYVNPINEHVKAVNDAFKTITGPVEVADGTIRAKVRDYRAEQQKKAAEIERINRLRIEAAEAEAKLNNGEIKESIVIIETPPMPPAHVYAEAGTLGMTQHWQGEVIDFALLPNEYKVADLVKLGKVIRAGLHTIPGVRIWSEDSLRISPK